MVNYYNSSIIDAKYGDVQVAKMCYGSETVWEHTQPVTGDYFATVARTSGTISFSGSVSAGTTNTLSYSADNGATWSTAAQTPSLNVNAGDKVLWKGTCTPFSYPGIGQFTGGTAQFDVEGNAMSLLYGDNFTGQTSLAGKGYAFRNLFSGNTNVISAENLSLPATTLSDGCYFHMFRGCTSLATAPQLPATSLAQLCYAGMFYGCTSLTTAPELSSTTLASSCYGSMFYDCTSLTEAPELPAMTLADSCYNSMFRGCTSLTSAPALPATTLANWCYGSMFGVCRSLTTAPALPATTLAQKCYASMFEYCTSLTTPPVLSAMTLASECYSGMFNRCTSLTTAPELPATTLVYYCYNTMFEYCRNLNSITCLATDISAYGCTSNWVNGVAATGTFTKSASMTGWTTGNSGIPNGWTTVDYTPEFAGKCRLVDDQGVNHDVDCQGNTVITQNEFDTIFSNYTITALTIGACCTQIDTNAFYWKSTVQVVTIGSNVTMIGDNAFNSCGNEYHMLSSTPPSLVNAPFGVGWMAGTIYVPQGSLQNYLDAPDWADYAENGKIVEEGSSPGA